MAKVDKVKFALYGNVSLYDRYEFYDYGHALEILATAYPEEWREIQEALERFTITESDIVAKGGADADYEPTWDTYKNHTIAKNSHE